jgi:hypothetical protein
LAAGKSPRRGILVDYLGNFQRSVQDDLPVFRVIGGAGFVWSASFDGGGLGRLRFFAIDSSTLTANEPPVVVPALHPQTHGKTASRRMQKRG